MMAASDVVLAMSVGVAVAVWADRVSPARRRDRPGSDGPSDGPPPSDDPPLNGTPPNGDGGSGVLPTDPGPVETEGDLTQLYRRYNERHFGGALPSPARADLRFEPEDRDPMSWTKCNTSAGRIIWIKIDRQQGRGPEERDVVIRASLLHEMAHAQNCIDGEGIEHDAAFCEELRRLANETSAHEPAVSTLLGGGVWRGIRMPTPC